MTGGATLPSPSLWSDGILSSIFTKTYPKPITTYYPYTSATITPAQPTSIANSTTGTHASSLSGTESGLKITLAVSICLGSTSIALLIWLVFRRLAHRRSLNQETQLHGTRDDLKLDKRPQIYKQSSDYMMISTSGTYLTGEKLSRLQSTLPEKTCTEFTTITVQPQSDRNFIYELDSEYFPFPNSSNKKLTVEKHFQTNASNYHQRRVRLERGETQRAATCTTSRSVRRQHLDGHKYSLRLRRFKEPQPIIKANHQLKVYCQELHGSLLFMGVLLDGEAFL
jgi:hypothetical protein